MRGVRKVLGKLISEASDSETTDIEHEEVAKRIVTAFPNLPGDPDEAADMIVAELKKLSTKKSLFVKQIRMMGRSGKKAAMFRKMRKEL